ncbi:NmrA family NAD(P)-binding protein [Sphaerisporangium fuscum]|uniref:NmrA family NAD(P)-binding protein n=1 Tax=Sphaerisporangium fuscum TaxID=2835868 RepID=UPI001BDCB43D|nr:NmrA family NAD(P)-binding protein [Sphaerisporangium fuscum]
MTAVLVIGATGKQGGAVTDLLLRRGHDVTAYVRSPESQAARSLAAQGVRLMAGDLADREALAKAAAGAEAVFGLSVPFGPGGMEQEIEQGRVLVDVAAGLGVHLVYSSVRGGDRTAAGGVEHAGSKQRIEAYLRGQDVRATVLGPVYFTENLLNLGFTGLGRGVLTMPLSPDKKLDQVTVLDIAGMAVHAIENPGDLVGRRVDLASDSVTGREAAAVLGRVIGREIPYEQMPIEQVRRWAGQEIAAMFQSFEENTQFLDTAALRERYPEVGWHDFEEWARTVDWDRLLAS